MSWSDEDSINFRRRFLNLIRKAQSEKRTWTLEKQRYHSPPFTQRVRKWVSINQREDKNA